MRLHLFCAYFFPAIIKRCHLLKYCICFPIPCFSLLQLSIISWSFCPLLLFLLSSVCSFTFPWGSFFAICLSPLRVVFFPAASLFHSSLLFQNLPQLFSLTSFTLTFLSSIGIGFPQIDCIHFLLYFSWKTIKWRIILHLSS